MNSTSLKGSWKVATIMGIPMRVHFSWLIVFGLITWLLSSRYFPIAAPDLPIASYWVKGVLANDRPVFYLLRTVLNFYRRPSGPGGLWLMLIGWFLYSAAQASYQQSTLQETLSGIKVKDIMVTDLKTLIIS